MLARVLHLAEPAVTSRLHRLMVEPAGEVHRRKRLLRGRVLVPLAGVVVAATAVGALLFVQADDGQQVITEPGAAPEPSFVMTNADGSTTPVYIGDDLDVSSAAARRGGAGPLDAGSTRRPPRTPNGVTVVNGEGLPVAGRTCRRTRCGSATRRSR